MDIVLPFSIIGVSGSIFLGCLFLLKRKKKSISNKFLGLFFLLLSIRLGKLLVQEYAPDFIVKTYFNIMLAAFLAIGPAVWFYTRTYFSIPTIKKNHWVLHFLPSLFFLLAAHSLRQVTGEGIWIMIYWAVQFHPIAYVLLSLKFLFENSRFKEDVIPVEKIWIYSLLATVLCIVGMNILYFTVDFPFYQVTAVLMITTVYLITFLAFNDMAGIIFGKSGRKYENLNLDNKKTNQIRDKIDSLLKERELFLNEQVKLSDISDELNISSHMVSGVINKSFKMSFPQYVNLLRIRRAQQKLINEHDKKIITIALESGFSSLSAFNRAFKENSNMNPSDYRAKFSLKKVPDL